VSLSHSPVELFLARVGQRRSQRSSVNRVHRRIRQGSGKKRPIPPVFLVELLEDVPLAKVDGRAQRLKPRTPKWFQMIQHGVATAGVCWGAAIRED